MVEKLTDKKSVKSDTDQFDIQFNKLSKIDFDGHTEFRKLSYRERLMWLSQAVQFSNKHSKARKL